MATDTNTLRLVLGKDTHLEFLTSAGVWETVQGVKTVHPLTDVTDPVTPTLGRVELSVMPIVTEAQLTAAAASAAPAKS